jgi:hypothetical protein
MNVRQRIGRILAAGAFLVMVAGCAHIPGGLAPSNTPIEGRKYRILGPVKATDSCVYLFGLIPVSGSNSTREAIRSALMSKDADALIDVTVECYDQWWILFTRRVTAVHGKAIVFEK